MVETQLRVGARPRVLRNLPSGVRGKFGGRALHLAGLTSDGVSCGPVTPELLQGAVELWGLLQLYQHLICGKNANGEFSKPNKMILNICFYFINSPKHQVR